MIKVYLKDDDVGGYDVLMRRYHEIKLISENGYSRSIKIRDDKQSLEMVSDDLLNDTELSFIAKGKFAVYGEIVKIMEKGYSKLEVLQKARLESLANILALPDERKTLTVIGDWLKEEKL